MRSLLVLQESLFQLHIALFKDHINYSLISKVSVIGKVATNRRASFVQWQVNVINGQHARKFSVQKLRQDKYQMLVDGISETRILARGTTPFLVV